MVLAGVAIVVIVVKERNSVERQAMRREVVTGAILRKMEHRVLTEREGETAAVDTRGSWRCRGRKLSKKKQWNKRTEHTYLGTISREKKVLSLSLLFNMD